jgi:hypothetical protein
MKSKKADNPDIPLDAYLYGSPEWRVATSSLEFDILLAVEAAEVTSEHRKTNMAVLDDLRVVPMDEVTPEERSRIVEIVKYHFS